MKLDDFNINKIKFTMKIYKTNEEKLSYLYSVKKEINRVIYCFERQKSLPLHMYAQTTSLVTDGCPELSEFLQKQIDNYDFDPFKMRDKTRMPPSDRLESAIKKEVLDYLELSKQIDAEIEFLDKVKQKEEKEAGIKKEETSLKSSKEVSGKKYEIGEDKVKTEKFEKADLESLKKQIEKELADSFEVEEAVANKTELPVVPKVPSKETKAVRKRIVWSGTEVDLIKIFELLFREKIISKENYEQRFFYIDKFFMKENGDSFSISRLIQESEKFSKEE